jgi:hypothetical protein
MVSMILIATALILSLVTHSGGKETCKCKAPKPGESTHWGGNEWVAYADKKIYKSLHGEVYNLGYGATSDVLVEVLDNPDYLLYDYGEGQKRKKEQRVAAACVTGADGKFCFKGIPPGKYELRFSKDEHGAWSPTHVYVVLNPRSPKSTSSGMMVQINVGF